MAEPSYIIDSAAVHSLLHDPNGPVGADIQRRTMRVHGAAVRLCPVDKGRLRSSLRWETGTGPDGPVGIVGTDVEYALFVHDGTLPHDITPNTAGGLFWDNFVCGCDADGPHPVMIVHHPGTTAQPFLADALVEAGE